MKPESTELYMPCVPAETRELLMSTAARLDEIAAALASGRIQHAADRVATLRKLLPAPQERHVRAAKVWGEML